MIQKIFLLLSLFCIADANNTYAAILGIFEDTKLPEEIATECDAVHHLEIIDNELYAATEKGIYKYSEAKNTWSCWALEDVNVLDFKAYEDSIVAIIVPYTKQGFRAVESAELVRLNRKHSKWEDVMNAGMGYTYRDELLTYVMRIAQHPTTHTTLMIAAYPGIWISENFGSTWNLKFEGIYTYNEHQFLGWHPANVRVLFYTSENFLSETQILRSENGGEKWDKIEPDRTGENACHHLAFDPRNPDHILYSGEGCIFESNDCGKTWQYVLRANEHNNKSDIGYVYNVMFDPAKSGTAYAVGCSKNNQRIYIYKSSDNGKTWAQMAQSDMFDNMEYWLHESVLLNGKIYMYSHKGVLAYPLDNSSSIDEVRASDSCNNVLYDLSGRKIQNSRPGTIYIKGGKKIIVR